MFIYFSTNEVYYSKLFRYLFGEPSSHIGLGFFSNPTKVIDCTRPVGKEHKLSKWLKKYYLVSSLYLPLPVDVEKRFYTLAAQYSIGKPYDFSAYYWGMLWGLIHKLTKIPFPETNIFENPNHGLCTEILQPFKEPLLEYGIDIRDVRLSAVTPHMLCDMLYDQTKTNQEVLWDVF